MTTAPDDDRSTEEEPDNDPSDPSTSGDEPVADPGGDSDPSANEGF